jgi:uncharacterized membrane protein
MVAEKQQIARCAGIANLVVFLARLSHESTIAGVIADRPGNAWLVSALVAGGGTDTLAQVSRTSVPLLLAIPALAGSLVAASTLPAAAKLSVCNKTAHTASLALGFFDGKNWGSTGWWMVAAGSCTALIEEPLNGRFYYVYAEHHDVGGAWVGDRSFCVKQGRFTIHSRTDCMGQGYEVKRFFQVDTGSSIDWTENLAD